MRTLIHKLFIIIILSVHLLFVPSAQRATKTHEYVDLHAYRNSAAYLNSESTTTRKAGGLDFTAIGAKRQGREVLLADVSGHGVPVSLISAMVKIAFASNTAHAANPANLQMRSSGSYSTGRANLQPKRWMMI
jgi:hypothetical protein